MKRIFLLVLPALLLISCKGETDYTRVVRNNTNQVIRVRANGATFSSLDFMLDPGRLQNLYVESDKGGNSEAEDPGRDIVSMLITNAAGDTCQKDFHVAGNWTIEVEKVKKTPKSYRHTYTFEVNESDF